MQRAIVDRDQSADICERRGDARMPLGVYACLYTDSGFHIILVENVSQGGAYVSDGALLPVGQTFRMSLMLDEDGTVIKVRGQVVFQSEHRHLDGHQSTGMGLQFTDIEPPGRALLDYSVSNWFAKATRSRGSSETPRSANA